MGMLAVVIALVSGIYFVGCMVLTIVYGRGNPADEAEARHMQIVGVLSLIVFLLSCILLVMTGVAR